MTEHDQKISDSKFVGKWQRTENEEIKQDLEITIDGKIDTRGAMSSATQFKDTKLTIKFDSDTYVELYYLPDEDQIRYEALDAEGTCEWTYNRANA